MALQTGTGMTICTNEDAKVLELMEVEDIKYFMGDGNKGLLKKFGPIQRRIKYYQQKLKKKLLVGENLCLMYNVEMSITQSKKVPSKHEKDVVMASLRQEKNWIFKQATFF